MFPILLVYFEGTIQKYALQAHSGLIQILPSSLRPLEDLEVVVEANGLGFISI